MLRSLSASLLGAFTLTLLASCASPGKPAIDNSAIGQPAFREHKATYGLVYRLPKESTDLLDARISGPLRERLIALGLRAETQAFNLPHVTVLHIHSADPTTPQKMLKALPKLPPVIAFSSRTSTRQRPPRTPAGRGGSTWASSSRAPATRT